MTTPDHRLLAVAHRAWPAGGVVVLAREDGVVDAVRPADAALLARCRTPVDPEQVGREQGPAARQRLDAMLRAGWLESEAAARARLGAAAGDEDAPGVDHVAVPTRGPSAHLDRLLEGLRAFEPPVRVYVDDPSPAAADAVRRSAGDHVSVVGATERAAWAATLAEVSGRPDDVAAALTVPPGLAWRVGALRNLVLLQGAGRVVVSIDDDMVPEVLVARGHDGRTALGSAPDPTDWHPMVDRADAWAGAVPTDPSALLEAVVGARAATCLPDDVQLDDVHAALAARVADGERVVVATLGIAGDNGGSRASSWLVASAADRARLFDALEAKLTSRSIHRAAPRRTLTDAPFFMTPVFAVDGRALVPPFLPVHRNTDGLWGATLARVASGLVAHLPHAVRHDPPGERRFALGDVGRHAARFRTTDLMALVQGSATLPDGSPADRLEALGAHVAGLATAPEAALRAEVEAHAHRWAAASLAAAVRCMAEPAPDAWRRELKGAIDTLRAALARPLWTEEHTREGQLDVAGLRRDLARYGRTLSAWPTLMAAARRLG